jgi:serine/threonine-protein kinase
MSNLSKEQWRSFSQYLDEALHQPDSDRAAWLARIAASDPHVAAELERKLAARRHTAFDTFLSDSPFAGAEGNGAELIGKHVGPYLIDSEIGRGGMGSVWRGRRTDGKSNALVAIKFVHTYWLGKASAEQFRGKKRLVGRLEHPNIERLIGAGIFNESQPYLALEYIEGEPISGYCERLALGVEARLALFGEVLAAVAHAHRHLIIHRDLNPTNIYVTADGVVKLLDFAIAKLLDEDAAAAATQNYALALSPQYAAPEQLLGQAITTATDVHGLGLVLYVLLAGEPAIAAEGRSNAELIRAVIDEPPRLPSGITGVSIARRRALKGDLDNIIAKALKKDPSERYASVDAFADDLRRYLSHRPVRASPDSVTYRLGKLVRRMAAACRARTGF